MVNEMKYQQGFSIFKMLILLMIIGSVTLVGYKIIPVYNAQWKIQDTFDGIVRNMAHGTEDQVRRRLPELFKIKYLAREDVPEEFYDNIAISTDGSRVVIASEYSVTVWLLGPVEEVDPRKEYDEADLKGMDKIRHKARYDFYFEPYAETP